MQWQDYERNIKDLLSWYKKSMNDRQHEILFKQIEYIPAPVFKDIVESLINDSKYWPTIQEIKNRYMNWRSAHPEQSRDYEKTLCLDCHGKGFLWTSEQHRELLREYICCYRCGSCQNWKGQVNANTTPFIHRSIAEKNGIEIIFPKHRAKNEEDLRPIKTNHKPKISEIGR